MKSKTVKKKEIVRKIKDKAEKKEVAEEKKSDEQSDDNKEEDIPTEHIKGLNEALENSDIGKPFTLKEFKKMMKKFNDK
jgi:hypothetical protein